MTRGKQPVANGPPALNGIADARKNTKDPELLTKQKVTPLILALIIAVFALVLAILIPIYQQLFGSLDPSGATSLVKTTWQQIRGSNSVAPSNTDDGIKMPEDEACIALVHWLPNITHVPGTKGFANQWRAHWAEQAQNAVPSCVARPRNATEVSQVVTVLKNLYDLPFIARARGTGAAVDSNLRFVVRSGGHGVELGQSSINGGVLIDLALLRSVEIADDRQSVLLGPGARWGEVFDKLEQNGLITAGGRNARVGVGGLSLGGGLSWISPEVGMVQDNILEYQIVLANGSIVTATEEHCPDLWRALKGGSGNFGIVTQFKARTFPATTKVWGGYVYYYTTKNIAEKLINAVHNFAKPENFDPHAAVPILSFGMLNALGIQVKASCTHILYTKPQPWPSVWQKSFKSIFSIWPAAKLQTYASAAEELVTVAGYGKQQHQATITVKNDLETMRELYNIYEQSWEKVKHVEGIVWALVYQPLTPAVIHKGGSSNVLGLDTRNASDPLLIVLLSNSWTDPSQNDLIYKAERELIESMEAYARLQGTLDRYLYLNYAASWQKVFESYGEENHKFLQDISRKYDEHGFWQFARAGGFKLGLGSQRPGAEAYPSFERPSVWNPPVHTPPAHVHGHHHDDHHHDHSHHHRHG